ncbi:MAG: hypothetical protein M1839_008501 [Geoglossum umbratile]|nr:MAG: hypothetical protein M1839_008501 [Geoglossum umbratile]
MAGPRTNQYFIPGEGISREVIQADICRYLGNDALVRPGQYQGREGYFLTAYRNLTSAMIADLKADSQRWESERRDGEARGYPPVQYRSSAIHQSRQYYGPSDAQVPPPQGGPAGGGPPVYVNQAAYQQGYGDSSQYPAGGYPQQGGTNYAFVPGASYAAGSEPRNYAYQQAQQQQQQQGPQQADRPGYDSSASGQQEYSSYGQAVAGPGQAPRGGQPQYQPRDPYGRGGYNYPAS